MLFNDREDAGRQLAKRLGAYKQAENSCVIGLARGGVVVAYQIAASLQLPLHVIVVRKVGAPHNEELALGAIAESGEGVFNDYLISALGVSSDYMQREVEKEKRLVKKRLQLYRNSSAPLELKDQNVILVDDGIATGASMLVAIKEVRALHPKKIILAVPVAAPESLEKMHPLVEEIVALSTPLFFEAVGAFYRLFQPTTDEEIVSLLEQARRNKQK